MPLTEAAASAAAGDLPTGGLSADTQQLPSRPEKDSPGDPLENLFQDFLRHYGVSEDQQPNGALFVGSRLTPCILVEFRAATPKGAENVSSSQRPAPSRIYMPEWLILAFGKSVQDGVDLAFKKMTGFDPAQIVHVELEARYTPAGTPLPN